MPTILLAPGAFGAGPALHVISSAGDQSLVSAPFAETEPALSEAEGAGEIDLPGVPSFSERVILYVRSTRQSVSYRMDVQPFPQRSTSNTRAKNGGQLEVEMRPLPRAVRCFVLFTATTLLISCGTGAPAPASDPPPPPPPGPHYTGVLQWKGDSSSKGLYSKETKLTP